MQRTVILGMFLTLIASAGGNSGSQSTALVVRALALGELKMRDWLRVMYRELGTGLCLGLLLGGIGMLRILIWGQFLHAYGVHYPWVALTVGLTLVFVVLWGTISGAMLPFLIRRLGFDPAVASAPFVATFVDVTAIIIYFTIAQIVLRDILL
jgi:magnesium transporter